MTPAGAGVDRATAVRRALLELVAERGFHGASMSEVATRAGVGTGTAYVHYASKDELVHATYREVKSDLGQAAVTSVDPNSPPEARFRSMWRNIHAHLAADPRRAEFLVQMETSPYVRSSDGDEAESPLVAATVETDIGPLLAPLPPVVLYDLGFGPVARLVASGSVLTDAELDRVATACWRAVTHS